MNKYSVITALVLAIFAMPTGAAAGNAIITNPSFDTGSGVIAGALDLNLLDPAPTALAGALGGTGWYALANATAVGNTGFRPQLEVNQPVTSPGQGLISYALSFSLGGLAGAEMPDSYLWQPLVGAAFAVNTTYTFALDVTSSAALDATALASRGFGIGLTSNSTSSTPGSFVADSLSSPALLSISLLSGSTERLVLTYTTGANAPTGDMGVVIFAGRGTQGLNAALLNDYRIDNASLAVPEPSAAVLLAAGVAVLIRLPRVYRARLRAAGPLPAATFSPL